MAMKITVTIAICDCPIASAFIQIGHVSLVVRHSVVRCWIVYKYDVSLFFVKSFS